MKLIISEYLSLLKEDKELDNLITDLLISMGITPLTKPQKGRQFGVDISAVGIDPDDGVKKVFLFVVKQGNLTRDNWDTGKNAVRPSINEILDTYITSNLSKQHQKLPKSIIVATNGDIEQTVNQNWVSFINKESREGELEFSFWGTDALLQRIEKHLMNEALFPNEHRTLLLKTLSFLELPDYDLRHFYELLQLILIDQGTKKVIQKKFRLQLLCVNILHKWCEDADNLKPSLIASERSLLLTWNWMRKENLFAEAYAVQEFQKLHLNRLGVVATYFSKIQMHCHVPDSLYGYSPNTLEYSLTLWEQIGHISLIGISEFHEAEFQHLANPDHSEYIEGRVQNATVVAQSLYDLIMNNSLSSYPKYDEHCIEISLGLFLLYRTGKHNEAKKWLKNLIAGTIDALILNQFFPLFYTDFEKLADIELGNETAKIDSSILLTVLAEWCVILDSKNLYSALVTGITQYATEVKLLLWFPEEDTEDLLYVSNAMAETGSTKLVELPAEFDKYKTEIIEEREKFKVEDSFTIHQYSMYYLGLMASRHYRSYIMPLMWRKLVNPINN